jgi:hypothetical protein
MNPSKNPNNIINQLKASRAAGLSFEVAKQRLLNGGYTDEQISEVTDDFDYNQPQSVPDIPKKVTGYFNSHPTQAVADGNDLLRAQRKEDIVDERTQAVADAAGIEGAKLLGVQGIDIRTEYESKLARDVGVSFWFLVAIQIVLNIAVFIAVRIFDLPTLAYCINGILFIVLIVYLIKKLK